MLLRLIAVLMLLAAPAAAQVIEHPEPTATVPGAAGVTYLDLMREVVPDLSAADQGFEGTKVIPVRHIAGDDWTMDAPERPQLQGALEAVALGHHRHMLLFDLGNPEGDVAGFVVLALFDTGKQPRLLDAVNVGFDRFTDLVAPATRPLGGGELVVTQSSHFNSSQNYVATALILLRDGRFSLVDDVYTFSDAQCSFERTQELEISLGARTGDMADILATVDERLTPAADACSDEQRPEAGQRTIAVTYRWDASTSRYLPDSDAFDVLATENEQRF